MLTTENISYVSDACTNGGTDNAALKYAEKKQENDNFHVYKQTADVSH